MLLLSVSSQSYLVLEKRLKYFAPQQEVGSYKRLQLHTVTIFGASTLTIFILDMIFHFPKLASVNDESNSNGEIPIQLAMPLARSVQGIIALLIAYPESLDRCQPIHTKKHHPINQTE